MSYDGFILSSEGLCVVLRFHACASEAAKGCHLFVNNYRSYLQIRKVIITIVIYESYAHAVTSSIQVQQLR